MRARWQAPYQILKLILKITWTKFPLSWLSDMLTVASDSTLLTGSSADTHPDSWYSDLHQTLVTGHYINDLTWACIYWCLECNLHLYSRHSEVRVYSHCRRPDDHMHQSHHHHHYHRVNSSLAEAAALSILQIRTFFSTLHSNSKHRGVWSCIKLYENVNFLGAMKKFLWNGKF